MPIDTRRQQVVENYLELKRALDAEYLAKLSAVDRELEELQTNPERGIAELLHKQLCHSDHTDQCGWYYSKGWTEFPVEHAHKTYLAMANRMLAAAHNDVFLVEDIIKAMKG